MLFSTHILVLHTSTSLSLSLSLSLGTHVPNNVSPCHRPLHVCIQDSIYINNFTGVFKKHTICHTKYI